MVRYKISCTLTGEQIFALLSRALHIEDLDVQEINTGFVTTPEMMTKFQQPMPKLASKLVRRKSKQARRLGSLKLDGGSNKVVMDVLADGLTHRHREFQEPLVAAGFSKDGVSGILQRLENHELIVKVGIGQWRLQNAPQAAEEA